MILIGVGKNGGKIHKVVKREREAIRYDNYRPQCETSMMRFFTTNGEVEDVTCNMCKDDKSIMTHQKVDEVSND